MDYLIGHLVGDYILQNDWMAVNKKKPGWAGTFPCLTHCLLWTISVMVFTGWSWLMFPFVFASHYVFDRTQICMWWMKFTKKSGQDNPFFPLVYVAVDNTCHLVCLWVIQNYLQYILLYWVMGGGQI